MKNVVITGSTRGLGYCMAKEFLKAGCNVTVSGRNEGSFEDAKAAFSEYSEHFIYVPCNVRERAEIENLWIKSEVKWGQIDIWINNAGQNCPFEFVADTGSQYIDAVIDTNIRGVIHGSQIASANMLKQGHGQIWNMEGLGSNDMIQAKTILYGTSKHALTYFTKGLAKELEGTPVTAGRLSPGMMLTDFMTKTPDNSPAPLTRDDRFRKIFNILADKPDAIAQFFVPKMLENTANNAHIIWLSNWKSTFRFLTSPFYHRKLV